MDRDLQEALAAIAQACGFDIWASYASLRTMIMGIRQFESLPSDATLTDVQRAALLENVAAVIRKTCSTGGHIESVRVQSRLERWRYLRRASHEAADAYAGVLSYLGVEVPDYMLRG